MSKNKLQKLELTWIGKGDEPKLEPRILIENPEYSYGDPNSENILIHGDNLLALKALEQDFAGKVKCIYIDPPYNTGNAFEHYDDGVEHSLWLNLMKSRLEILKNLLSNDGSIWISIDDKECHYLKVMCDEIFGRNNFIIQTTIQRGAATGHKAINPTPVQVCDLMLTYAKDKTKWVYKPVYKEREYDKAYSQIIINFEDDFEEWKFSSLKDYLKNNKIKIEDALKNFPERIIRFAQPDYKSVGQDTRDFIDLSKANPNKVFLQKREGYPDIYLIKGNRVLFYIDKMRLVDGVYTTSELVTNLWADMNYQGIAKEGNVVFAKSKKPELQVKRIFDMSTEEGDLVLDSFLGSGTTSAVALKMKRKFIGIELGEHAKTHCYPRLKTVVDGEQSGISKSVNYKGGGGFKFYTLAPSLLKQDKFGNWVISQEYNPDMLAAAMAKQEGFNYLPHEEKFWKQGNSSENDFIFTTTQFLTVETLDSIHDDMQEGEKILICCKAFQKECKNKYPNISLKKIPQMLLDRCEFGKDDYSLNIVNMPKDDTELEEEETFDDISIQEISDKKNTEEDQQTLF